MSERPLIHVVDDDDSLRTALVRLLEAAGFAVRAYASAGDFLLHRTDDGPGCLLLDVRMPGPSGLELQQALQARGGSLPIVFLSGHADLSAGIQAMKAGAVNFLTKPVDHETLFEALRRALARDERERAERAESAALRRLVGTLTPRERSVFEGIVAGRLNKQIADDLGIAERTVKAERAQVMAKLKAASAAELGRFAERLGRLTDR